MSVEIQPNTPLGDALNLAIQGKIADLGWAGGGAEGAAMSEYFVLMLANGKSQDEIAAEITNDLLGLAPEDDTARSFAAWLFEQIHTLSSQLGSASTANTDGQKDEAMETSVDIDTMTDAPSEVTAPTGPKAMRNGVGSRGRDNKRIMGQINRAMDRSQDSVLHRVRNQSGNERIGRGPPSGPRMGVGRQPRSNNIRPASIAQGLAHMGGMPPGPPPMGGMNGMNGMPGMNPGFMPAAPDLMAIMEEQRRMLQQMSQQLMMSQQQGGMQNNNNGHGHGRSLYDRTSRPNNFRRGGGHHQHNGHPAQQHSQQQQQQNAGAPAQTEAGQQGEDVEMSQTPREAPNPDETVCRFNLRCQNKDCKFAHQSPAAPPNITIDVHDVCNFGAACKNRKCVGRHPSPANKMAHQSEQDCKFYPNCTNPHCPFKHPSKPPCRNGGECKVPNCPFTHLKVPCKFRPCTNRFCSFMHEEGQRGTFSDKVWVAGDNNKESLSERKFVDESAPEDLVLPGSEENNPEASVPQVVV
ncbi:nuclear polyadenylated RNA-binding protein nab2 [Naviculisporaceae sp. PSN 640]